MASQADRIKQPWNDAPHKCTTCHTKGRVYELTVPTRLSPTASVFSSDPSNNEHGQARKTNSNRHTEVEWRQHAYFPRHCSGRQQFWVRPPPRWALCDQLPLSPSPSLLLLVATSNAGP